MLSELQKMKIAKSKGILYNKNTGEIIGVNGKKVGVVDSYGYVIVGFRFNNKKYQIKSHRYAWYYMFNKLPDIIDHINNDKTDNRIMNLRNVSQKENTYNRKTNKGYKKSECGNKYLASITVDGKGIHLGTFNTKEDARIEYLKAKEKYHTIKTRI
jgi:hypothetical protein